MTVRTESVIEAEIEQLKALAAGRALSDSEQDRINELIVERAAAYRAYDAQWRTQYVRERRQYWHARDMAKLRTALRPSGIFLSLVAVFIVCSVMLYRSPSDQLVRPLTILFIFSGWIISLCVHEFGHAIFGFLGGDRGVMQRGYLNMDPRRYTNPLLSIALPVIFILIGGFGLPGGSVVVDRAELRSKRWDLLVSIGGPLGTLLCLLLAGMPFLIADFTWVSPESSAFFGALGALVWLLIIVLLLNLLPIPPLDGFQIISHWMSEETRAKAFSLGWAPVFLLFMVLWYDNPAGDAFFDLARDIMWQLNYPGWYVNQALDMLSFRSG